MPLSETDKAYLAGILDGEGCISFGSRAGKYLTVTLQVTNTNFELIKWLIGHLGAGNWYGYAPRVGNRRPCYLWSVAGKRATDIIRQVLPYLVLKRPQAELTIALPRFKNASPGKPTMTEKDYAFNGLLLRQMRELNRRGLLCQHHQRQ